MRIKLSLLCWRLREVYYTNVAGVLTACAYALFRKEPHTGMELWPWLFILAHSGKVAYDLGRTRRADFAYLHSRGLSSDALWAHTMLAAVISALFVLVPVALIIGTPLRSTLQDAVENPYFPIFYAVEWRVLLPWAVSYLAPIAFYSYAWIHSAQSIEGRTAGDFMAAGFTLAALVFVLNRPKPMEGLIATAIGVVVTVLLFRAGRILYRAMEVS